MRATWITSAVAGAIFGTVIHLSERGGEQVSTAIILPLFFVLAVIGVIGITQVQEIRAERKKRGLGFFGFMAEPGDFSRFYFPGWGRIFVWFITVVGTILCIRAWLP